ncbi:MAG: hypothetical protein HY293_00785 [Planctomycetes bacterium]|nr:hypothetical protein [Planctomycetota bacterium]
MVHSTASRILVALVLLFLALPIGAQQAAKPAQDDKKTPQEEKKAAQDEKKANEEAGKKAVAEFDVKIKECKTIPEKALAILTYGDVEPKDKVMVPPLARFLGATASDMNFVLVTSAAEALGHFRGIPQAAAVLGGALAGYKKNPYVASKLVAAIGRVGHESSLAMFEESLKGTDPNAAVGAIWAIADFPGHVAVTALFAEDARIEADKTKQGTNLKAEYKAVYDKVQPEIVKAIKKITGEIWPTIKELTIWWKRNEAKFKEASAAKEKEKKPEAAARTTLPPVLLVELCFKENAGTTPANSGASGAGFPTAQMTPQKPSWTATAAPNSGPSALDFDKMAGAYAVDLGGGAGIENLKNLKSFTITGWTINWDVKEGASDKFAGGGSRILSWFNPGKINEGVELVFRSDGSLQLGIGQWAEQSAARSKPEQIPLYDSKATNAGAEASAKWRFFAVTYDSGLASSHVKFYIGTTNQDPKLINACEYNRGPSGAKISPVLTIGNVTPMTRPMAPERTYRGILDDIRIFGSTLDGSGALPLEELIKIQNRVKTGA